MLNLEVPSQKKTNSEDKSNRENLIEELLSDSKKNPEKYEENEKLIQLIETKLNAKDYRQFLINLLEAKGGESKESLNKKNIKQSIIKDIRTNPEEYTEAIINNLFPASEKEIKMDLLLEWKELMHKKETKNKLAA